jgi:hypothetical protein
MMFLAHELTGLQHKKYHIKKFPELQAYILQQKKRNIKNFPELQAVYVFLWSKIF